MAETTTTKKQRMGIWIVTIVMIVATVTMFAFMIWATQNSKADPSDAASEKVEEEYKKQQEEYEKQTETADSEYVSAVDGWNRTAAR